MSDLEVLNLANNQLNGQLTDMFQKLSSLTELDLSSNHLTGNLPKSFATLENLRTLNLQNNQFTGTIDILAKLSLEDVNIENNHFSGWIPDKLKEIDNLRTEGNSWSSGPAPPDFSNQRDVQDHGSGSGKSGLSIGAMVGIFLAILMLIGILLAIFSRKRASASSPIYSDEESMGHHKSFTPLVSHEFQVLKSVDSSPSLQMMSSQTAPTSGLKPPASEHNKSFTKNGFLSKQSSQTEHVNATVYSSTDVLTATGNFATGRLLGEGSIGCVYKASFSDGKILAVKKMSSSYLGFCNSEDFLELVSGISRLRHPNLTEIVGYCLEPGYQLLVYEFVRNGSLHDFLHLSDEYSKPLTWDTRVRIALGTARAIEYLHEVCSPSVIHKNIKSANILLDLDLNPHLSDSGLTVFYEDTSKNLGPGYNPPEVTNPSTFTSKSDVYSFGVVMLELLTGRMPFDDSQPWSEQCLVRWATPQLHDIDALTKMVDPALRGLYPPKALSRFADIIALCVQSEPEFRPPMSEVVQALVRCIQRPSFSKRGGDLSASRRSDDSDGYY